MRTASAPGRILAVRTRWGFDGAPADCGSRAGAFAARIYRLNEGAMRQIEIDSSERFGGSHRFALPLRTHCQTQSPARHRARIEQEIALAHHQHQLADIA